MREPRGAGIARVLVRWGHARPWTVVLLAILVVVAGGLLGAHLSFETDVLSLMPRNDPVVHDFRRTLDEFGSLDTLLVVVRVGDEDRLELALALVDRLADTLSASPRLSHVQARLQDPLRLADTVLGHAVLFLDQPGLEALVRRLSASGLAKRAADIRAAVEAPHGMIAKELATRDPLGLLPLLLDRLNRAPSALKVDFSSGYYLAEDHSLVLLLAKPVRPAQDIEFDQALFPELDGRVAAARQALAAEEGLDLDDIPAVELGGGHRIAVEDANLIRADVIWNSVTSVLGVMVLFYLAYRRLAAAQYAFLPLAVGLALTFVFTAVALGRLNSATSAFAALLVGLGIDFTIVMYGRYLEARLSGLSLPEALEWMATHSGPAVLLGAVTTVGTFFAFLATRFVGLKELGLLTGTGIVLMAISAFILLPALVTLMDRGKTPRGHPPWLNPVPLLRWASRNRRAVLIVTGIVIAVALAALPYVQLDDDVRNLRSRSNRGVAIQDEVAEAFGLSFNAMMIRVQGADEGEVMARVRDLARGLDPMVNDGTIVSYDSLANLVPPTEAQDRSLRWIADNAELTDPGRVRTEMDAALVAAGLVPGAFAAGLETLDTMLRPPGPVSLDIWRGTPVEEVVERSLHTGDGWVSTVINVLTPPGRWRRNAPPALEGLVGSVEGASLTGVNLIAQRLRKIVWEDAALAGGVGLAVVFLMLLWELKEVRFALACLLPVAVGVLWMVATTSILQHPLNFFNVFVITMVIGVGVDYGIHMVHRLREQPSLEELGETARTVILAALTTIVGFGSLITTHYPGLQSIGWLTSLGVFFSCVAAVLLLPLVIRGGPRA